MSFADNLQTQSDIARTSVTGLGSLREYLDARILDLQEMMDSQSSQYLLIPKYVQSLGKEIYVQVTNSDLIHCVNEDVNVIQAKYNAAGDSVELTAEEVSEYYEEYSNNLQLSREFLGSCLDNAETSVDSWTSAILAKYSSMSASMVDSFAQHFKSGDKIAALQSWISTYRSEEILTENGYLEIVKRPEFGGDDSSVIKTIISDFTDSVEDAFAKVVTTILDLKGLFANIWEAVKALAGWILKKTFRSLSSNLESGSSKIGVLDMPIFQSKMCDVTVTRVNVPGSGWGMFTSCSLGDISYSRIFDAIVSGKFNVYSKDINNNTVRYKAGSVSGMNAANGPIYAFKVIAEQCYQYIQDTASVYVRTVDICWNNDSWDPYQNLCFRWGLIPKESGYHSSENEWNYDLWLQVFYLCESDLFNQFSDYEIFTKMRQSWQTFIEYQGTTMNFPCIPSHSGSQYSTEDNAYHDWFYNGNIMVVPDSEIDGPMNYTNYIKYLGDNSSGSMHGTMLDIDFMRWLIYTTVVTYSLSFGPFNVYADDGILQQPFMPFCMFSWCYDTSDYCDRRAPIGFNSTFKPYSRNNPTPVSIHFQSLQERATEWEHFIIITLIAIAAAYITFKLVKFRKNLRAKTAIARAQADNFSWTQADLTPEKIAEWKKLDKVARKYERLSAIFGIATRTGVTQATNALINRNCEQAIKDGHISDTKIEVIERLIVGPSGS